MKKKVCFLICLWFMNGLVSCNFPARSDQLPSQQEIDNQYQVVSAFLTKTAQAVSFTKTITVVTPTPAPSLTYSKATEADFHVSPTATAASPTRVTAQSAGKAKAAPCDLAQLGFPIDINVPDGTHFRPEETFSKTWRLVNAGSCRWTPDYAAVWFSGNGMGLNQAQPLNMEVRPGGSIDITVDMIAPAVPGMYQSNWKMRNSDGVMFGIGPSGDAPFWVRIMVVPVETPTVTPVSIDATPTPAIFASGSLTLLKGEGVDLDSAQVNQAENDDLSFQITTANELELMPLSGAHLAVFGNNMPQITDCNQTGATHAPILLEKKPSGEYFCYRTTKGLPGRIVVKSVDLAKGQIELEFITWVVP